MTANKPLTALIIFCALMLTSCGGSETVAGIGGTGITTSGTITGFGSVIVNDIKFETDASSITVDHVDFNNDQSGLAIGMVVTVTGTINDDGVTGSADTIFYDDEIEGPVSGLARNMGIISFNILGQAVSADTSTVFDDFPNPGFDTMVDGDFVEVSGFIDNSVSPPVIRATRIEKKGDSTNTVMVDIEGAVGDLDTANKTFMIGSVSVTYDVDTVFEDMTEADLQDLILVEVRGNYDAATGWVNADFIKSEDESDSNPDEGSNLDIEGIVSEFAGIDSFVVLGQLVDANNAVFDPSSLKQNIGNGDRVEVEGTIVNGVLVAVEVEMD